MFSSHASKVIITFLSLSVLTIGFLVFWLSFGLRQAKFAQAEIVGTPLRGYAWADTYGWISLNCRNDNSCATSPYWVGVDEATGHLDGYAWSDNVGWISFRKTGLCLGGEKNANGSPKNCERDSDCSNNSCRYFNPPDTTFNANCKINDVAKSCSIADSDGCMACYNNTDRQFYGWARVLSDAADNDYFDSSWVKLDGTNFDLKVDNTSTSQNPPGGEPWGDLLGWTWGGANSTVGVNSTSGIGWISFNCNNSDPGGCTGSNTSYKVTGRPEDLGTLKIERIKGNESYGLNVNWSAGYPAYGATSYEVWRQNGQCYENNQPITPNEDCDSNAYCSRGTCNLSLPYDSKWTVASGSSYDNKPLNLFVTYNYVVRACNIFGCSKTSSRPLKTSPMEHIRNFKATPICATAGDSYVDIIWNKPYIVSLFNGNLARYELEYCKLDVTGDVNKCGEGLMSENKGFWINTIANCNNLTYDNATKPSTHSCREVLIDGRSRSKDFFVYRIRGIADKGTCLGGDNDGQDCTADANCSVGGGVCDFYKSTWAFSNTFRVCPVGTSYQEQRPQ